MAFHWPTFRTRALTAIVFAALMLTGLLLNKWSFFILFSIIHFGCWWEYLQLTEKIHAARFHIYTKLGWMVMGYGLLLWFCKGYSINNYSLSANLSLPVSAAGFTLLMIGIFQHNAVKPKAFAMAFFGLVYISLVLGMMIDLRTFNNDVLSPGWLLPIAIIASIWINDTMAYIVGSLIGKTPLSKISPKKTWEGTIGGIILAVAVCYFLFFLLNRQWPFAYEALQLALLIALPSAIIGTIGDLFESKLKRMAGVKDSGSLMPGHGGFLDRFDSLLFAIPVVWLLFKLCF